jgi:tuberculosinol/isotuberculosinol synthase
MLSLSEFRCLPQEQVARLVREAGPKVCVFPVNGTRRWFLLEHPPAPEDDFAAAYLEIAGQRHIALYRLLVDYGLDMLLTPVFGPDLLARGGRYMELAAEGLARLATHPDFLTFYEQYGVRVRFYGDFRQFFGDGPYTYLLDLFEQVAKQTLAHDRHRLFYGICAHDPAGTLAELAVDHYRQQGCLPDKQALVKMYYGEYVPPVDLFIGFDKFCAFDMPLVATGNEDLYFTVCPSPYLTDRQLREILYDHLYARRGGEVDYSTMTAQDWRLMREFYEANAEKTLGVGARDPGGMGWYPLPQVVLPPHLAEWLQQDNASG